MSTALSPYFFADRGDGLHPTALGLLRPGTAHSPSGLRPRAPFWISTPFRILSPLFFFSFSFFTSFFFFLSSFSLLFFFFQPFPTFFTFLFFRRFPLLSSHFRGGACELPFHGFHTHVIYYYIIVPYLVRPSPRPS